jgi:hypothetical protein
MNSRFTPVARLVSAVALALAGLSSMSAAHADSRFVISADGKEVTDTQTKLVWQRCTVGQNWDGKVCAGKATKISLAKAKELGAAMTPAWHLPTKEELLSIVDKTQKKPATDKAAFPGTPSAVFWATQPGSTDNLNAWLVNFKNGRVVANTHNAPNLVRLVRPA